MESGPTVPPVHFVQMLRPELAGGLVKSMAYAHFTPAQILSPSPFPQPTPTPAHTQGWCPILIPSMPGSYPAVHVVLLVLTQGLFCRLYGSKREMQGFQDLISEDPYYHVSGKSNLSELQFHHL